MAKIYQLQLEHKEQYVVFDDCDSQTDYFHSTRGSLKYIISAIQKYGGDMITVNVTNNAQDIPAQRRVNAVCKACGYTAKDLSEMRKRTYSRYPDNVEVVEEYKHLEWILTKSAPLQTGAPVIAAVEA